MKYALTHHARDLLAERHIPVEWMERALGEPELKLPDPMDVTLERRYRKIPEHQDRVLRVVVGAALRASEEAAKKRVNRALEKLRTLFSKRGVVSTTAMIAGAISANSVQAAPVALAKSVTAVAMAKGAAASGSTLILIKGALKVTAWTQAKTAAVAVATVIVATGTTTVVIKTIHLSVTKFPMDNLDAKIARLSHPGATVKEVLQVLGEPVQYDWNGKVFEKHHLPETYQLEYPQGVAVWVSGGRVQELRSEGLGRGFIWQGKLRLGSSLDEVLEALGPPSSTVVGKPLAWEAGVLYKDIEGRSGRSYYARPDQSIRLFFMDNKVVALYVVLQGGEFGSGPPGEPIPDIDAKITQLSQTGTTVDEVIRVLGEPTKYLWGNKTFKKDDLPKAYLLVYSGNVNVMVYQGRVVELRSEGDGRGFIWQGKLRLGSSLDEVLQGLGPPSKTVVGKPLAFEAGVLYKDIDGKSGYCYYAWPDQNVRLFLVENKVTGLYITLGNSNR
jgi:hypothetical protein